MEQNPGLNDAEVQQRLERDGYNELPSQKPQNVFETLLEVLKEPMLIFLLICGTIYMFLGEFQDALMLLAFVFVLIGIIFYQGRKTEHALQALKDLSSPQALVIRNGIQVTIPSKEVVVDDIIILHEGDRIPADGFVISCNNLNIDESLLTGESLPVHKTVWDNNEKLAQPGGENMPFVFSGTLVTQGKGLARVTATGIDTEIGKIGKSLNTIQDEKTLLDKEIGHIVKIFLIIGLILCAIVITAYGLMHQDWLKGVLSGLTLGMSMLPEEFPVVLMIFLTLGAWRMSKKNVLTRKNQAIETLGATTVLCVDKTGTITMNQMRLHTIVSGNEAYDLDMNTKKRLAIPVNQQELLEYAVLASEKDPFDPIERELHDNIKQHLPELSKKHSGYSLVKDYPLSKDLLALSHVWKTKHQSEYVIATKGAPEAITELCHLQKPQQEAILDQVKALSDRGLRVLGVAKSVTKEAELPKEQHDFDFQFLGLIGFADPIRQSVPSAVKECYNAGIRVIMITGDYPGTAQYLAQQAGIANYENVLTGPELKELSPKELKERIKITNIFARVVPEQKLIIVKALKSNGEIVAMTGDGVNDSPALKSAHIGISMGKRGTDVAREASDLVLLDDNFSTIVSAVKLGRRIFDNLRKAVTFIFSVHIPIAGLSVLPVLFNLPVIFFPAHIAFLELIIDPACSTVYESEKEEDGIMNRPPRNLKTRLFNNSSILLSLVQGFSVLIIVFLVYLFALNRNLGEDEARALSFTTLVLCNLALIITNLSKTENVFKILRHGNKALYSLLAGTVFFLTLLLTVPFIRNLFHFAPLHFNDIIAGIIGAIACLVWFELMKFVSKLIALRKLKG